MEVVALALIVLAPVLLPVIVLYVIVYTIGAAWRSSTTPRAPRIPRTPRSRGQQAMAMGLLGFIVMVLWVFGQNYQTQRHVIIDQHEQQLMKRR